MSSRGPAFPMSFGPDDDGEHGMLMRDWFATHAPTEIPHWFEHIAAPKDGWLDLPQWLDGETEVDRAILRDWIFDQRFDLPGHLQWFQDKLNAAVEAQSEYEKRDLQARYFQWRWYYADQMIEAGEV